MTIDTSTPHKPKSWAEDLNTYRDTRGSRSFGKTESRTVPKRYCRTNLVPFCDTRHPLYAYDEWRDGGDKIKLDHDIQQDRQFRHGWGDISLLKEDGYAGTLHPRGQTGPPSGKGRTSSPRGHDGRNGLFGVLQMTEAGGLDSWIGNGLVDPTKGKRALQPPSDPKGRKDLFDVLHCRTPGVPADDSWLGNALIDPAKGKAHPPGPEQLRGRTDLTDIVGMSILHDPNRTDLLRKGADPLGDAWCGNILIDPSKGKMPIYGTAASSEIMHGATFRNVPKNHTDFPNPHAKQVPPSVADTAHLVLTGQLQGSDWGPVGKRHIEEQTGKRVDGRKDLYANMTFRPVNAMEQQVFAKAWDDSHTTGRSKVDPIPGSVAPNKGIDMLAWKPEQRLGSYVPYAGLMQEGRKKTQNIGGTMRIGAPARASSAMASF